MLKFQKFMKEQNLSTYAETLVLEAILTFRIEAYRSSFLTTYLGFLVAIRDRILDNRTNKPSYIKDSYWSTIIAQLQNEDIWEAELFNIIQNTNDSVFKLDTKTRDALKHWRHERNLAAHGRKKEITSAQVEYFWDFIENNLSKFFIGGGKEHIIGEIKNNFDMMSCTIDYDYSKNINFLFSIMTTVEFEEFIVEIFDNINKIHNKNSDNITSFWNEIAHSKTPQIRHALINLIKKEKASFVDFYTKYPAVMNEVIQDISFVKDYLFNFALKYEIDKLVDITIFYINNNLLTEAEIQLFFDKLIKSSYFGYILSQIENSKRLLLNEHNFLTMISEDLESKNLRNFHTAFENESKFIFYITYGDLNEYFYDLTVFYVNNLNPGGSLLELTMDLLKNNPDVNSKYKEFQNKYSRQDLTAYL